MSRTRTVERVVLAAALVGLLGIAYGQRKTRTMLRELATRTDELDMRVRVLTEAGKIKFTAPPPSAFEAPKAEPARQAKRSASGNARTKVPPVPGAQVLDSLYSAADELAQEQDWDAETYDQVARVFESTTSTMMALFEDLQAGRVNQQQARQRAIEVRDEATERLGGILGPAGFERLKEAVRDELPAKRR